MKLKPNDFKGPLKMKLKLAALATLMAVSAPSFAAMDGATSGNGSLILNFITPGATGTSGMSALFDLGINMDTMLSMNGVAGFNRTWNLTTGMMTGSGIAGSQAVGTYGTVWSDLLAFGADNTGIEYSVIALDNTNANSAGGSRYLSTGDTAFANIPNASLNNFAVMQKYIDANNGVGTVSGLPRGTHSAANGASTATPTDDKDSYFRAINGFGRGDNWLSFTGEDTTKKLATEQNFWFLQTSSTVNTARANSSVFGADLDGNGSIGAGEYGLWSVDLGQGTVTFATPVPEATTWAMLLAGLGMVGVMARRRHNSA